MSNISERDDMRRRARFEAAYYDGLKERRCELLELNLLRRTAIIRLDGVVLDVHLN